MFTINAVIDFVEAAADGVIAQFSDDPDEDYVVVEEVEHGLLWLYSQPGWIQMAAGGATGW